MHHYKLWNYSWYYRRKDNDCQGTIYFLLELEEPRRTRRMNDLTKDIREHIAEMKEELGGMKDNLKCVSPPQLIK